MELLILLLLILLNGVFSMSEIALVSARKSRLEGEAQRGDVRAKAALELANDPNRFLSTVQIGITLIGILIGIYSGENVTADVEHRIQQVPVLAPYAHTLAISGVVVVITFFSLVLGELVPKRIGLNMPVPIAKLMALPMRLLSIIAAPFIWLLTRTSDLLLHLFGFRHRPGGGVTEEEIRALVEQGAVGGAVEAIEHAIVERVFTLGDRKVSTLMTYRRDVEVLPVGADAQQVRNTLRKAMHTYYPVVAEDPDTVLGVVSLEALLQHLDDAQMDLWKLMQPPVFMHEDMAAYKALEQFKQHGQGFALVSDTRGTTIGLVTMSDILEALVGDVSDFRRDEYTLTERADGSWIVDGNYPLPDLLMRLDRAQLVRDVEADTIAGLVLQQAEHIPVVGERVGWMGFDMEVVAMDGARIAKVIIRMAEDS